MSRINFVDTVIGEMCEAMGLGDRTLDNEGQLTLRFDDTQVTFTYGAKPIELLWLQVDLGAVPGDPDALRFLLLLGYDSWSLNRMTIGLDSAGRNAWGYSCIPVSELNRDQLEAVLKAMLEVAMPIRQRLEAGRFELNIQQGKADEPKAHLGRPPGMLRV
ncbi:MAG: type III secretion system chaperone [Pseudomonadota bacterium]